MAEKAKVLLVEDEVSLRTSLVRFLEELGHEVIEASTGNEALERLRDGGFNLVVTDLRLPGADGLEILRSIQGEAPHTLGILVTGFGSLQSAIDAMKLGAFDYLLKPLDLQELELALNRALEFQRLHRENRQLRKEVQRRFRFENMVGSSGPMLRVFELVQKVADSDSTILIYGESGTGKELVARAIHYQSLRMDKPLVPINCAAIPSDLLESELFGYERGAFTGAHRPKIGRFEYANGGTLFLDEIGEMSPQLQVKLLRVLQERTFERLGGIKSIEVDARIIAATNQDLEKAIAQGRFREDLFYRLSVIPIHLPALRERKEDIPLLVEHFIRKANEERARQVSGISAGAVERLVQYSWPGNVRELENLVERLVVLKRSGIIDVNDLPEKLLASPGQWPARFVLPEDGINLSSAVERFERDLILQALQRSRGIKKDAARLLQMKRTTLIQKMKRRRMTPSVRDTSESVESTL
jgi:DNA-binding NtrC family response regulator